ncbi:bifunctional fucokinase/fucose-1-phosphate guanylyltransferase [Bacteroides sp. 519]|uniref:bifunctional fucokinase/fucose-1-phosphate guanylyltransferase n=1 Tax=Bacteroides sp. 519 TaxID=2302937 RepID=UPI0013D7F8C9|nr:bifunctional fucokinase/fucose-1-phosphate guanylyltransferase [Bacteroides sp. 519]NDV58581.1 bifunctional fucokinase/L-fucose-1-P-guanylyltransferase [Bacteroides sp. 519]
MQKLLSLPPNLTNYFYELEDANREEWFCTSDPIGSKVGSGGGTAWLLDECHRCLAPQQSFDQWLEGDKRILLHAGGQSRRLPAYAPSGKILTPIPVFRWERGQKLNQNLLSLQLPLYERIMKAAPASLHTLIASGDVYIRSERPLSPIPNADVVCYGLWVEASLATRHGVFVLDRNNPEQLDFMLQKPSIEELESVTKTHVFLMDIGIWLLSDKAVKLLKKHSYKNDAMVPDYYDLYSDFGLSLGNNPRITDKELNELSVAILPLTDGEFYHYGTSTELISSTLSIQNRVHDQHKIMHRKIKPNPAIFVQNAITGISFKAENENLWIENSFIGQNWKLGKRHILTGIPENNFNIQLPNGVCIDIVPINENEWVVRPYGMNDAFRGDLHDENTTFLEISFAEWLHQRNLKLTDTGISNTKDIQSAGLFPVVDLIEKLGTVLKWMVTEPLLAEGKEIWMKATRLSADEISEKANLVRLYQQREKFCKNNWEILSRNYEKSVFYQLDLANAAEEFTRLNLDTPSVLAEDATVMTRIHNRMLRSRIRKLKGEEYITEENSAFELLREGLLGEIKNKKSDPHLNVYNDQIVWARSPVRIDLAGGWTDTPPYSLFCGGNVVNLAIELNGQPPLQVYIKPSKEYQITLRSIDMGALEQVTTFEELADYKKVGSPFSIPKAALALSGFLPLFSKNKFKSLKEQLKAFGAGIEVTLLAAIPAGSGLGTSSILASTVLGAINDFCGLAWDKNEICHRTLVLEQLLTTGGGWQDQYGGVFHGVKLLQSESGFAQNPQIRWLPDYLFTLPEYKMCNLLYYTGITRTAKGILADIVSGMFLNSSAHLSLLAEMKIHALDMSGAILKGSFQEFAGLINKTWQQNKALDSGTNPPTVEDIINRIKDYTLGYKLPGAGGGGYLYMIAKDPQAAIRIREELTNNPPNSCARFVDMELSDKGLQISRS